MYPEIGLHPSWSLCLWSLALAAATVTLASKGRHALLLDQAGFCVVRSPLFL